ncbi:MAG: hypothetical protein EP343_16415 [Deltaproteobacteria bacterium]|nr:MAG: hypothetical protein EP343_16415 [Deltaproteobacteria bacterium]
MTASTKRRPKRERSLLVKIISSPLTTLVLGIFAFLSIVYYKVYVAPPEDDPKAKPQARRKVMDSNQPLLAANEILGKAWNRGPTLTRSFFGMGDVVIAGPKGNRTWGLIYKSAKQIQVVHPWRASQPLMDWLIQDPKKGRFALFRTLQPAKGRSQLGTLLKPLLREKDLDKNEQAKLQTQWKAVASKKGDKVVPAHWVHARYQKTGLKHLPPMSWAGDKATQRWLEQLIQRSHYSDILK